MVMIKGWYSRPFNGPHLCHGGCNARPVLPGRGPELIASAHMLAVSVGCVFIEIDTYDRRGDEVAQYRFRRATRKNGTLRLEPSLGHTARPAGIPHSLGLLLAHAGVTLQALSLHLET